LYNSQPRRWLHVDKKGHLKYETIDRQDLVLMLNISYRDVRILDPLVATPYPTAMLIREKALVINMEAVRMIICTDQCFVLSVPNPQVPGTTGMFPVTDSPFVKDLIGLIRQDPQLHSYSRTSSQLDQRLPYELRCLEAALQATGRALAGEVRAMDNRAIPALQKLLQKITEDQLEKLRATKCALNSLFQRVQKVRDELEETLDDDQDMLDMYLGRRQKQSEEAERRLKAEARPDLDDEGSGPSRRPSPREVVDNGGDGGGEVVGEGDDAEVPGDDSDGSTSSHVQKGDLIDTAVAHAARQVAAASAAQGTTHTPTPAASFGKTGEGGSGGLQRSGKHLSDRSSSGRRDGGSSGSLQSRQQGGEAPAADHLSRLLQRLMTMQKGGDGGCDPCQGLTIEDVAAAGLYAMAGSGQTGHSPPDPRDISECEGLLEVYFKQMDDLLRRLAATRARIADTEASIEVLLDERRNGLTALTLVVNTVMLGFAFVSAVVGGFGMNFATWMSEQDAATSQRNFLLTLILSSVIGFMFFAGVMLYARAKKLLFTPEAGLQ